MKLIPVPADFSYEQTLRFLNRSPLEQAHRLEGERIYKVIPVEGGHALLVIREEPNGLGIDLLGPPASAGGAALLDVQSEPLSSSLPASAMEEAVRYVRDWFDLDTSLAPFYEMARSDRLLCEVADRFYGLRNIGIPDLFEALCWAIMGQQIQLGFAFTLKKRFVERYGRSFSRDGESDWGFPEPERIAALVPENLTALQLSAGKSQCLLTVARLMAEGTLSKPLLLKMGDAGAAIRRLMAIRGIGPWTAHYVAMRCLRFPSAFPAGDAGLQQAVKQLAGLTTKPTAAELERLSAKWGDWRAYAAFYLWRAL